MRSLHVVAVAGLLVGALGTARCGPAAPASPSSTPSSAASPWFEEIAASAGLVFTHRSGHEDGRYRLPEIMGGGAALFDKDGDGNLDALLVQSGALGTGEAGSRHRLFENDGRGRFVDVSAASGVEVAGYGMGVAAGDYDRDGDVDLYVTNLGANVLLQNDGGGRFRDVTAPGRRGRIGLEHERHLLRCRRRRRPRPLRRRATWPGSRRVNGSASA